MLSREREKVDSDGISSDGIATKESTVNKKKVSKIWGVLLH